MRKNLLKAFGLVGALLSAGTSVLAQMGPGGQMPPARVEVVKAVERMMAPTMEVTGTVISLNDSRISSEVEGVLSWISEVGTHVNKGDVIAVIDDRLLAVNYRRAEASLKRLEADLPRREAAVKRFEGLAANDVASRARLEEVVSDRDMLVQDIADAKARLDQARGDLERTKIRARFEGNVVARLSSVGEYITVGEEVIRLVDTGAIEISLPAPIAVTPYLNSAEELPVQTSEGTVHRLKVRTVVPVGDSVSRQVEVRLQASPDSFMIGAPVTVSLPTSAPSVRVAVPRDTLVRKGSKMYVFRVNADGSADQLVADIAVMDGLWVSIADQSLRAGDTIILRGGERLQPGQKVVFDAQ
ncbi:MexH family multidrug efflux RND transporter periplasmic adaptor subunit [Kordiimonas sediminis]|uniref:MexH family multidrug efflux RND transporter periplasmic adaptor subunit n=1 Tax=Kordiimonas sediminis TaxID=1735581 RepID=A0A919E7B5_9PROT|nr:efflux RND transporter periplasmic adaptor subunit [Kordiimonas sediminis]GHF19502.1 MexH family multidrug efflux RND transporter periplasmic adaptor subunit [Kordiimonas sediminis]